MAGTEETNPAAAAAVGRLRTWAIKDARHIFNWGQPGDFERCRTFFRDKVPGHMIDGWCARLHSLATGARPGQAPAEKAAARRADDGKH